MTLTLAHFLMVSVILLVGGVATIAVKRNAIGILIGVELILNAAALNFVAAARFPIAGRVLLDGDVAALMVIFIAAAEAAVALAVFLSFYVNHLSVDVEQGRSLRQ